MTAQIVTKYPLDIKGTSNDNRVVDERHSLGEAIIVPRFSPFFRESLRVHKGAEKNLLIEGTHYTVFHMVDSLTRLAGKEINLGIYLHEGVAAGDIYITYQTLGGPYATDASLVAGMVSEMYEKLRDVHYRELQGLPLTFPPEVHLHDANDIVGLNPVTQAIKELGAQMEIYNQINLSQAMEGLGEKASKKGHFAVQPDGGYAFINSTDDAIVIEFPTSGMGKNYLWATINIAEGLDSNVRFDVTVLPNLDGTLNGIFDDNAGTGSDTPMEVQAFFNSAANVCVRFKRSGANFRDTMVAVESVKWQNPAKADKVSTVSISTYDGGHLQGEFGLRTLRRGF